MCSAPLVAAGISAGVQYQQAKGQADFQQEVQDRNATVSNLQAIRAANASNAALADRQAERSLGDADAKANLNRQALNAGGLARLGGAGTSVGAVLADLASQQSAGRERIDRSTEFADRQVGRDVDAIQARARGRSIGQYSIPQPSLALAAFSVVGSDAMGEFLAK